MFDFLQCNFLEYAEPQVTNAYGYTLPTKPNHFSISLRSRITKKFQLIYPSLSQYKKRPTLTSAGLHKYDITPEVTKQNGRSTGKMKANTTPQHHLKR
jgi:hypothetical protein